ncbi:hypothetical protein [Methylobacterium sp. 77]|uniref:hypothetical protein n=1 Tax=Methylobacterium sp. 77 TaxID=1101192 RepID=UPI00037AF076|nr:hypothetical protein [Methylobacterium sp. 77]
MSGKRGAQQRQRDIDATYSIDRRADPAGLIDRAPKREMKMVPFPRGGRLEMILVPADPTV